MTKTILLFFTGLLLSAHAEENIIPPSRLIDWKPGVENGIPAIETKTELSESELKNGDAAKAIQKAVDSIQAPGAVQLPAGEFICRSTISMKSGVVLRGKGSSSTRLTFDIKEKSSAPAIAFAGKADRIFQIEDDTLPVGSTKIQIKNAEGLKQGDNILISAENDGSIMYTSPKWDAPWSKRAWGQGLRIRSIKGNIIETDVPLRLDYEKSRKPTVQKIIPLENSGVEDLYIKRLDQGEFSTITFTRCMNCWVTGIESEYTMRSHIWIYDSRFLTISDSEFHHSYNYGGGGHGYGVTAGKHTSDCLVTNNIFHDLRHSMMTKECANGNVFSYNYSFARRLPVPLIPGLCDISIHGHYSHMNLFEGNVVEFVNCGDYWGPTGPYTTFFRNRVSFLFKAGDSSKKINAIGNTILIIPIIDPSCTDIWLAANRINGILTDSVKIPPSLYLKEKPSFWGSLPWPCIGADVDNNPDAFSPIPAQTRFRSKK